MNPTPTVFVYDDALETSEVLAAIYQPRGFHVERKTDAAPGQERRSVVVLRPTSSDPPAGNEPSRRVLIGKMAGEQVPPGSPSIASCRISSLFDYRELVREIDRLLRSSD